MSSLGPMRMPAGCYCAGAWVRTDYFKTSIQLVCDTRSCGLDLPEDARFLYVRAPHSKAMSDRDTRRYSRALVQLDH